MSEVADRVIIILRTYPVDNPYVASYNVTQPGLSKQLGVHTKTLQKHLHRLLQKGHVDVTYRHVNGIPHKMKCYFLADWGCRHG